MYILDTDHLSVLERKGENAQRLLLRNCAIPVIEFDLEAVREFNRLKKTYPRLGTMDLKIGAITIVSQAILLTRNYSDFGQIAGLSIEDWTV